MKEKLITSLTKLAVLSKREPGCLQYDLIEDVAHPNLVILIVKFANEVLMKQHENQQTIKSFADNELQQYCEKFYWHDGLEIS